MVKYVKYNKVETENTVLEFRGGSEDLVVTNFTGEEIKDFSVVSISSENEDLIDELISNQPSEISCEVIEKDDFKSVVKYSDQINRIRQQVKNKIAKRYDVADELAIGKLEDDNDKKTAYQDYVDECIAFGKKLKADIGY